MSEFKNTTNIPISARLAESARTVEGALDACYAYTPEADEYLVRVQRYGILGGGKRIRAFLVMESARLLGARAETALPYACAIEMMHASSLIHDDMECMDNDAVRRGRPAVHTEFGEAMALISGDAMCVKAFATAVNNPHASPVSNARAVAILAEGAGECGMLAGQTLDTLAAEKKLSESEIVRLHKFKTGKLISASVRLGCIAAGESTESERCLALVRYAENIGLAFQIIDDILDFESGERELNSFLSFATVDEARARAQELTSEACEAVREIDDGTLADLAQYLLSRKY